MTLQLKDGVYYVKRQDLAKLLKITPNAISRYETQDYENPLKKADHSTRKVAFYDLMYALTWHARNVDTKHRPQADGFSGVGSSYDEFNEINSTNAREAQQVEDAKKKRIDRQIQQKKLDELSGDLIRADDVDKSMVELAVLLLSTLRNIKDSMPSILANKSENEISLLLDSEFEAEVNKLHKVANK